MMSRSRSQGTEVTIVTGDVFYAQYDLMKVLKFHVFYYRQD